MMTTEQDSYYAGKLAELREKNKLIENICFFRTVDVHELQLVIDDIEDIHGELVHAYSCDTDPEYKKQNTCWPDDEDDDDKT